MQFKMYFMSILPKESLPTVVVVVSAEWVVLGPASVDAPDLNTEHYWVLAFYGSFHTFILRVPNLTVFFQKV